MRIKFTLVYILAGIAFLGVSLWVFLSKGKSARAVGAKYRLGGIMLTAASMLSAASCESPVGPVVTCYEPAVPPEVTCYDVPAPVNSLYVSVKDKNTMDVQPGDILLLNIENPSDDSFLCNINARNPESTLLQSQELTLDPESAWYLGAEITIEDVSYKGEAVLSVFSISKDPEGNRVELPVGSPIVINYL